MKLGKKKSIEYKLVAASCSSYLLGIVCLTVFGYFYEKLPFRDVYDSDLLTLSWC